MLHTGHSNAGKMAFNPSDVFSCILIHIQIFVLFSHAFLLNTVFFFKDLIYQFLFRGFYILFVSFLQSREDLIVLLREFSTFFASSFFAIVNEFMESSVVSHFHFFSVLFAFSGSICQFLPLPPAPHFPLIQICLIIFADFLSFKNMFLLL